MNIVVGMALLDWGFQFECFDRRLILQRLVAPETTIVGGVGSQPALRAELTAVPGFVKSSDTHGIGLEQFLDDVTVRVVEVAQQIGFSQRCQVNPYPRRGTPRL